MKRIIVAAIISLFASVLYAQKDTVFHKHEIRVSYGDAVVTSMTRLESDNFYSDNISFSYYYCQEKNFWIGVNFVNYFGEKTYYDWREYDVNGSFQDFYKSKMKYSAIIAPEIRLSCVNEKAIILYGALSGGIGIENGYDTREQKYPNIFPCFHLTCFGFSCNFGEDKNIFLGCELGIGFKGLVSIHGGFRF